VQRNVRKHSRDASVIVPCLLLKQQCVSKFYWNSTVSDFTEICLVVLDLLHMKWWTHWRGAANMCILATFHCECARKVKLRIKYSQKVLNMAWACGYNKYSDLLSDWENELFLLTVTLWILTDLLTNKMEHRCSTRTWATWSNYFWC